MAGLGSNRPQMKPGINGVLPIYPNESRGGYRIKTNSKLFPLKASDISRFDIQPRLRVSDPPSGEYNFAYQMYQDTDQLTGTVFGAEVMIWLRHTFGQPPPVIKVNLTTEPYL
jgi:hypothetical protein